MQFFLRFWTQHKPYNGLSKCSSSLYYPQLSLPREHFLVSVISAPGHATQFNVHRVAVLPWNIVCDYHVTLDTHIVVQWLKSGKYFGASNKIHKNTEISLDEFMKIPRTWPTMKEIHWYINSYKALTNMDFHTEGFYFINYMDIGMFYKHWS